LVPSFEEARMIGVTVTFEYDGDFDPSRIVKIARDSRSMFEGMPGVRLKVYTFDEKHQRATNFYLWETQEAAEAFFSDELRQRVTSLYGVAPVIDLVQVAEIVDNSRT
jgi:hypothetical protein